MNTPEKYRQAVAFVESFSNSSIRKNVGENKVDPIIFIRRTEYFLNLLGNPGKDISYIHVTGTAGKGTVSTMLQEVLIASGKKTGLFTSPYVTTTIDKMNVDGKYISPLEFINLVEHLKPFIKKAQMGPYGGPSAFELFFAVALLYFEKMKCTWVVLEVGLGGRYDATNVIENPVITAVTNIDYDHTEILGNTFKEIATDKAGIIKPGSSFFTSEQRPVLQRLFKKICKGVGADFNVTPHQRDYADYNRELVRAIGRHLHISKSDIEKGIRRTRLPCRFEIMQRRPLVILDGAHNKAKIRSTIFNLKKYSFKKLYLIVAIAANKKDNRVILKDLLALQYQKHMVITHLQGPERKTLQPDILMETINSYRKSYDQIEVISDPHNALKKVMTLANKNDLILVTGSFFLSGELRKRWFPEEVVLKRRSAF